MIDAREVKPLLATREVAKRYRGRTVVKGVDLTVGAGEIVGLLGPNGAGKTTTLLTISGLIAPLAGSVTIGGEPVDTSAPHRNARRGLAHVAEDRSLFGQLSVEENLKLGLRGSAATRADGLEFAIELMPALRPLLDRKAGLLSGGEQQMLAMARALASRPKLLMVDEMSLGLAPVIVEDLLPVVRRIASEADVGVLLVEQHVHMALEVADRGYVLNRGRVVMEGPAERLKAEQHLLQASYLGGAEQREP